MKSFDLEAAMRGEKVVTRDGREFKFGAYSLETKTAHKLIGWVDGVTVGVCEDGRYFDRGGDSCFDLFMAPKKIKLWRRLWKDSVGRYGYYVSDFPAVPLGFNFVHDWEEFEVEES